MKHLLLVVLVFSIVLCSCAKKYEDKRAKNFLALKNGQEISYADYDALRRTCNDTSGIIYFKRSIKEITGKDFSEEEIRNTVVFNDDLKVVLRKKVENTTTEPKGR